MYLDLFEKLYLFELERKQRLEGSLSLPTGLVIGIGGLLGFVMRDFSYRDATRTGIFLVLSAGALVAYCMTVYHLFRSYYHSTYTYRYLPWPSELREYYEGLARYQEEIGGKLTGVGDDFDKFLRDEYVGASQENAANNDSKAMSLFRAKRWLMFLVVLASLLTLPYTWDYRVVAADLPHQCCKASSE